MIELIICKPKADYLFHLDSLREDATTLSEDAVKLALNRLSGKGKILSIHKG